MSYRRIVGAVGILIGLLSPQFAVAASPSFDCTKASTAVERLLCKDDGLAKQDRLLAALYKKTLRHLSADRQKDLRADQRRWAKSRARDCPDLDRDSAKAAECLTAVYQRRITALQPMSLSDLKLYPGINVQFDRRTPLTCLRFDAPLAAKQAAALESYVESKGGETLAARITGDELCVQGLAHGGKHTITVRAGLKGEGAILRQDQTIAVEIPDRPRRVAFPSSGLILPRVDVAGLPIEAINMETVRVLLLRIDDDDTIEGLKRGLIDRRISYSDVGQIVSRIGQNVWTGEIETGGPKNAAQRVAIPIKDVIPDLKAGVYLAVAEDPKAALGDGWWAASQWFVVSDIGLTAFVGRDGLAVAARSLSTALPRENARIKLIANDGKQLA